MEVDSGQRVIVAYGEGDFTDKAQFILANNYPDQNLSEEGLHWQWQTDLILGDDAALLQLFENDIKRDELRYGSDFGKLAENDSTQDSVYVLKREGYEKGQNTSDYPEYAKQAKDWEQQGDIALIKGDYVLRELHLKRYELKDHLGNVRVIVADVKDATLGLQGQPREFAAILKHYSNYYPFGMEKPAMVYDKGGYRYGFNGKENDDEVKGVGNHQDYGMRVYDPRIAKFLSVDPLTNSYPWYTPYQFAGNKSISCVDLDGAEELSVVEISSPSKSKLGEAKITISLDYRIVQKGFGSLKRMDIDCQNFKNQYDKGDKVVLYAKNLPKTDKAAEFITQKEAETIISDGSPAYKINIDYEYTLTESPKESNFEADVEWIKENPQRRGLVMDRFTPPNDYKPKTFDYRKLTLLSIYESAIQANRAFDNHKEDTEVGGWGLCEGISGMAEYPNIILLNTSADMSLSLSNRAAHEAGHNSAKSHFHKNSKSGNYENNQPGLQSNTNPFPTEENTKNIINDQTNRRTIK